jgi:meiotically up-regulated gene 157 (Mug157) protein
MLLSRRTVMPSNLLRQVAYHIPKATRKTVRSITISFPGVALNCLLLCVDVHPAYEPLKVFECKYELDSLAHFLALSNTFYNYTQSTDFLNSRWYTALDTVLSVIGAQSQSTFNPVTGRFEKNEYTFRRRTDQGTETLSLSGVGNPLKNGTGLVRSAFR